jgi:predicted ATPase/DNA-binding SARP family transcriptional activator
MSGAVDIRVLGPVELTGPNGWVKLHGAGQRTLIARLGMSPGETVSRDGLIDALWGEVAPPTATKTLHSHLAHLRHQLRDAGLAELIVTRAPGYALLAPVDAVDAVRFENLAASGRDALAAGNAKDATDSLRAALAMWRGEAFTDCRPGEWTRAEAIRLGEVRLACTENLISAQLALGEHLTVVSELEFLIIQQPFRERLWELLVLALYRSGRQADALAAFQRVRTTLIDELGIEPGPQLRQLEKSVLTADPSLDLPVVAETTVTGHSHGRLPILLTNLVDRDDDLDTVRRLLAARRLVTIIGPGGCGKTRLAIAVATGLDTAVRFVDLTPLAKPDLVAQHVAHALGLFEQAGRSVLDHLLDHLRDRGLLLVLDNCEHLVDACANLVSALVAACPWLHVLATSREPLHLPGEAVHTLRPLATPDPAAMNTYQELLSFDAVRLFIDRARDAGAQIGADGATTHALAAICAGLDGLPLALELAAARTTALTVSQIAEQLSDGFPTLLSGSRVVRPQHRALHTAIKWSYDLLKPDERTLLRRLAVFVGGFGLPAVEALWPQGDAVDLLGRLVEQSLVSKETGAARYRLLGTMHRFATDQLTGAELARARQRHAEFHLSLAEQAEELLDGPDSVRWLDRLAAEHENMRAAMAWAIAPAKPTLADPILALRLASALAGYCRLRGHYRDGREWLGAALAQAPGASATLRAKALKGAAVLTFLQCEYDAAVLLAERSLVLYESLGDLRGVASTRSLLGSIWREQGEYPRALASHQSALEAFQAVDDAQGVATALQLSAFSAWLRGDLDSAEHWARDCLHRFQELGDAEQVASALRHLGAVAHYRGDNVRADQLLTEARSISEGSGCLEGIAWALNLLGLVHHATGSVEARALLDRSLTLHRKLGDRWRMASVREALAAIACDEHRWDDATRLLEDAAALRTTINTPIPPCERPLYRRARAALDAARQPAARSE